jgi:spermidine/putrescine transport system permease protein
MRARGTSRALSLFAAATYLFLYAPILVLVAFSFNQGRLTASWEGFTLAWYAKLLDNAQVLTSLRNSLVVAFAATLICTVIGTAAALALHRHRFRRQGAVE